MRVAPGMLKQEFDMLNPYVIITRIWSRGCQLSYAHAADRSTGRWEGERQACPGEAPHWRRNRVADLWLHLLEHSLKKEEPTSCCLFTTRLV